MTDTITLPREVIERAISALQGCYDVDSYPNDGSTQQDASLNELLAALERQDEVNLIGFLPSEEKMQQTVISQTELRAALERQAEPFDKRVSDLVERLGGIDYLEAKQAEQVPDAYQFRMRADWVTNWSEWTACNKEQHEMYLRVPKLHDWNYETRALYAATVVTQQDEVGINGLTESETNATMSVMGLSKPRVEEPLPPIYYMRDNHTFKKLSDDVTTALVEIETEFNTGYTYGSLFSKRDGFRAVHANGEKLRMFFLNACKERLESLRK